MPEQSQPPLQPSPWLKLFFDNLEYASERFRPLLKIWHDNVVLLGVIVATVIGLATFLSSRSPATPPPPATPVFEQPPKNPGRIQPEETTYRFVEIAQP